MNKNYIGFVALCILFVMCMSCSDNITDWEKEALTWEGLPKEVQVNMKECYWPSSKEDQLKVKIGLPLSFVNLENNSVEASYKYVFTGAGRGYTVFNINNNKYELHSSSRGNKENPPYILYEKKMYYVTSLNVFTEKDLLEVEFGRFDFSNEY